MMKYEFEKLIEQEVSQKDYEVIEFVYTWHPDIPDVGGKQKIADIWKVGGISLIKDMKRTAEYAKKNRDEWWKIQAEIEKMKKAQDALSDELHEYLRNR